MVAFNSTSVASFSNVVAVGTATIELPATGLYESLQLEYKKAGVLATVAQMKADITEIRVILDGVVQRRYSVTELFAMLELRNMPVNDGYINLFFSEPWRRNVQGEDELGWGMLDIANFNLEVDINTTGAVALTAKRNWLPVNNRNLGAIVKVKRYNIPVSSTGAINWLSIPRLDSYYAIHANSSNINSVKIEIDQKKRLEASLAGNNDRLEQHGLTPQTGWFHIMADNRSRVEDAWSMVKVVNRKFVPVDEVNFEFDMSAATSFNVLVEQLGFKD